MEVSELDKVVAYTKQFIDAATPIAKQAYEIGLVTIRIDAVASIVQSLIGIAFAFLAYRWAIAAFKNARLLAEEANKEKTRSFNTPDEFLFAGGIPHMIVTMLGFLVGVISVICISNVWVWVKLFAPQLWLAHQAVDAVLK